MEPLGKSALHQRKNQSELAGIRDILRKATPDVPYWAKFGLNP